MRAPAPSCNQVLDESVAVTLLEGKQLAGDYLVEAGPRAPVFSVQE